MQNFTGLMQGLAGGVASSIATDRVKGTVDPVIDETLGKEKGRGTDDILNEIHLLLVDFHTWYKQTQFGTGDEFRFVDLYKFGLGSPFIPQHSHGRQHFQIFTSVAVTLNCSGTGLGNFNVITKAADWTNLDFPDGSIYIVDAAMANSKYTGWLRETNAAIV